MAIKPKSYETLYLVRPDISGEDLTAIQDKLTKSISSNEGEIQKNEKWADRDLAYQINDYTKGSYYILQYNALPKVVAELEKHLSFNKTDILRFITVINDEEEPAAEPAKETSEQESTETTASSDFVASTEKVEEKPDEPAEEPTGGEG